MPRRRLKMMTMNARQRVRSVTPNTDSDATIKAREKAEMDRRAKEFVTEYREALEKLADE